MSRIISGFAKGLFINVFPQKNLRPTSCRAKEALFDIIQFDIKDKVFIDLFSGTGQIGIEALSRGAKKVIFVDHSRKSVEILKKNLKKVQDHCEEKLDTEIYLSDVSKFLDRFSEKSDFVFADAPFAMKINCDIFRKIVKITKTCGTIITETLLNNKQIDECDSFHLIKKYIYSKISLNFYKYKEEEYIDGF